MKTIYICTHCQSDNVEVKAWVKPNNNNQYVDAVPDEMGWCGDEQLLANIQTAEFLEDAKVIGFQVWGEDGSEQQGLMHPQMDASFCVYNLKQAHEMLQDVEDESEQWRLMTIWEGEIEEPTMMFEGDPRA